MTNISLFKVFLHIVLKLKTLLIKFTKTDIYSKTYIKTYTYYLFALFLIGTNSIHHHFFVT